MKNKKSAVREFIEALVVALGLALVVMTFVVQAFKIPSGSMIPTLQIGDHLFVLKFMYGVKLPFSDTILIKTWTPKRGDIAVFRYPREESVDYIKRVIGEPGDVIEMRNKQLYINGNLYQEPYARHIDRMIIPERDNFGPVTVPEGKFFMMGDNRDNSSDSRVWGFVNENKLRGKAWLIYWSWDGKDRWLRWERIGHLIH